MSNYPVTLVKTNKRFQVRLNPVFKLYNFIPL